MKGQVIKVKAKNITKAGIRATYDKEEISPITVFIARDHHYNSVEFSKIKQDEDITIKVIGIRYELNDQNISVLGELSVKKENLKQRLLLLMNRNFNKINYIYEN